MSSRTWTPDALSSSRRRASGPCWRAVEAQHHVSTAKLTDSAAEQTRLEELLEQTKPAVPEECRHLDWLLYTPFRYPATHGGSRFRKEGMTLGVFYAAELPQTAIAEMAFRRLLFFSESPTTPWPGNAGEYTLFSAEYATPAALDLSLPPLDADAAAWMDPTNYAPCQALAETARAANVDVIKYQSVRDPDHHLALAILTCRVFTRPEPISRQSWRIHLSATGARAICEFPRAVIDYGRDAFADDPRIKAMTWERPAS